MCVGIDPHAVGCTANALKAHRANDIGRIRVCRLDAVLSRNTRAYDERRGVRLVGRFIVQKFRGKRGIGHPAFRMLRRNGLGYIDGELHIRVAVKDHFKILAFAVVSRVIRFELGEHVGCGCRGVEGIVKGHRTPAELNTGCHGVLDVADTGHDVGIDQIGRVFGVNVDGDIGKTFEDLIKVRLQRAADQVDGLFFLAKVDYIRSERAALVDVDNGIRRNRTHVKDGVRVRSVRSTAHVVRVADAQRVVFHPTLVKVDGRVGKPTAVGLDAAVRLREGDAVGHHVANVDRAGVGEGVGRSVSGCHRDGAGTVDRTGIAQSTAKGDGTGVGNQAGAFNDGTRTVGPLIADAKDRVAGGRVDEAARNRGRAIVALGSIGLGLTVLDFQLADVFTCGWHSGRKQTVGRGKNAVNCGGTVRNDELVDRDRTRVFQHSVGTVEIDGFKVGRGTGDVREQAVDFGRASLCQGRRVVNRTAVADFGVVEANFALVFQRSEHGRGVHCLDFAKVRELARDIEVVGLQERAAVVGEHTGHIQVARNGHAVVVGETAARERHVSRYSHRAGVGDFGRFQSHARGLEVGACGHSHIAVGAGHSADTIRAVDNCQSGGGHIAAAEVHCTHRTGVIGLQTQAAELQGRTRTHRGGRIGRNHHVVGRIGLLFTTDQNELLSAHDSNRGGIVDAGKADAFRNARAGADRHSSVFTLKIAIHIDHVLESGNLSLKFGDRFLIEDRGIGIAFHCADEFEFGSAPNLAKGVFQCFGLRRGQGGVAQIHDNLAAFKGGVINQILRNRAFHKDLEEFGRHGLDVFRSHCADADHVQAVRLIVAGRPDHGSGVGCETAFGLRERRAVFKRDAARGRHVAGVGKSTLHRDVARC